MSKNILVVIPNRGALFYAWALEYALSSNEDRIYLVDVSPWSTRYLYKKIRWLLDVYSYNNNAPALLKKIVNSNSLTLIRRRGFLSRFLRSKAKLSILESNFETSIRSTYARSFGSSKIQMQDIPWLIRNLEKRSYCLVYREIENIIQKQNISLVVTPNGRLVPMAACVQAARNANIDVNLIEYPVEPRNRYCIYEISTHSVLENQKKLESTWNKGLQQNLKITTEIAVARFNHRISQDWSWRMNQNQEILRKAQNYIVFYPTTDYEFGTTQDLEESIDKITQEETFLTAARLCKELELELIVRVHPHSKSDPLVVLEDKFWEPLCKEYGATMISAGSSVDSIELARNSFVNIIYASSIAAEIGYLGWPLVLCSPTYFSHLTKENNGFDLRSLEALIRNPKGLQDSNSLLKFFYYEVMAGEECEHFKIENVHSVFFHEMQVDNPRNHIFYFRRSFASLKNYFNKPTRRLTREG